jgi:hypothetical protein
LAREWHPVKNGKLTPMQVSPGSDRIVWWKCPKGPDHEWHSKVNQRIYQKGVCPFCTGYRYSVTNSLATRFPALAAQWHPTRNGKVKQDQIKAGIRDKFWWRCPAARDHVWLARVEARTRLMTGCPFCARSRVPESRRLVNTDPEIAAQWLTARNPQHDVSRIASDSLKAVWWRCPKNRRHEWRATVYYRTRVDADCPDCG